MRAVTCESDSTYGRGVGFRPYSNRRGSHTGLSFSAAEPANRRGSSVNASSASSLRSAALSEVRPPRALPSSAISRRRCTGSSLAKCSPAAEAISTKESRATTGSPRVSLLAARFSEGTEAHAFSTPPPGGEPGAPVKRGDRAAGVRRARTASGRRTAPSRAPALTAAVESRAHTCRRRDARAPSAVDSARTPQPSGCPIASLRAPSAAAH